MLTMYKGFEKKSNRMVTCICIATLVILQLGLCFDRNTVYAEEEKEAYIVITKDGDSIEKLKEEYNVIAENGDALTVEISDSEAARIETDKDIICVEKDFTIDTEVEAGEDMVKPLSEIWNQDALNMEASYSNQIVKVAVIDSGIDVTDNITVKERRNFIKDTPVTTPLYEDFTGHGTSVASMIAGSGTGSDVIGTGGNIELYSARVLDENKQAPISSVVEAIYWAIEKDVKVINISFGTQIYSEALKTAIDAATDKGILVVAAAGNRGTEGVDYPAAFENVLAVGSVNAAGSVSDFSAKGEEVDVMAPGEAVLAQANFGEDLVLSGTSLAAPQVAGIAARLWSKDVAKPATFIKTLIKLSAKKIESAGSGYGLVDYGYALEIYDEVYAQFEEIASEKNGHVEETNIPQEVDLAESSISEVKEVASTESVQEDETDVESVEELSGEESVGDEIHKEISEEVSLEPPVKSEDEIKILPDVESISFEKIAMEQIEVAENFEPVEDLSDPIVDGSWGSEVHTAFTGNAAFKQGAVYADNKTLHAFVQGITGHPEFHGYAWHDDAGGALGTGDCNYMANYKFLVKIAAAYGRGEGYTSVSRSDVPGLNKICYDEIRAGIQGILDRDKTLSSGNADIAIWGKSDANQKAFVMGLAMHVATDTFAHSAFDKSSVGSLMTWHRIKHPSADDITIRSGRYDIAKAVISKVVDRQNGNRSGYDTCNDFHSENSSHYKMLDFRITKMKTFAEDSGYTNATVLSDFGKLQSQ